MQPANLSKNIWKYTVRLITNKRIYVPILGAYYLTIPDTTAQTIGLILLIGNVAGFIFEIPSGYVSDKIGHKQALVLSSIFFALSTLFYIIADNISLLILGSVFLSTGQAFNSGTGSAFMHETMRALNRENEYTKVMGKASSLGFAIPIILTVLTPFLVSISFKAPFILGLFIDAIGLFATISLVVPKVSQAHIEEIGTTNFRQVIQEGYRLGFFKYALFSSIAAAVFFSISIFRAPYQLLLEIPVIWFGVLFGIGRAFASLLLAYSEQIKKHFPNILSFFKFKMILYTILIFLLAATVNPWFVAGILLLINGVQWGLGQVNTGFTLEIIRSSKFKATLLSTEAQLNNIFQGVICFIIGFAIVNSTYQITFFALGVCYILVSFPIYLYIKHKSTLVE